MKKILVSSQFALFCFLCCVMTLVGCFNKEQEEQVVEQAQIDQQIAKLMVPELTEKELEKLGPKIQMPELNWVQSNGSFGVIVHPKRFLESKIANEGKDLFLPAMSNILRLPFGNDLEKIETIVIVGQIKAVQIPPQPGTSPTPQVVPLPFLTYCVKWSEPIQTQQVMDAFLPPNAGYPAPKLRKVQGKDVYDLPAAYPLETCSIAFVDDTTMVYVCANDATLNDVLDGKMPTGSLVERIIRIDSKSSDVMLIGTTEGGMKLPTEQLTQVLTMGYNIPETLARLLVENFKVATVNADFSAAQDGDIAKIDLETFDSENAKKIADIINDQITFYRTSIPVAASVVGAGEDEVFKKAGENALDAIVVDSKDNLVEARLKKFAELDSFFTMYFEQQRSLLKQQEEANKTQMELTKIAQRMTAIRQYMLKYHDEKGQLPPAAITSADGTPLLSWRVAILPYMGEKTLYDKFKLDESWDSENNKPLINQMPAIFSDPRSFDPTRTTISLFNSEGTPFANANLKMMDVAGPSNTAMIVAVSPDNAMEWTRPESLVWGKTLDEYKQLFGPYVPIITFEGQFGPLKWMDDPQELQMLEDIVKGKSR